MTNLVLAIGLRGNALSLETFPKIFYFVATVLFLTAACFEGASASRSRTPEGEKPKDGLLFWITFMLMVLAIHALIGLLCFHPAVYLVPMFIITVLEVITIRVNAIDAGKTESISKRFLSWFFFGLSFEVGLLLSVTVRPEFEKLLDGARGVQILIILLVGLLPMIYLTGIGLIRSAIVEKSLPYAEEEVRDKEVVREKSQQTETDILEEDDDIIDVADPDDESAS